MHFKKQIFETCITQKKIDLGTKVLMITNILLTLREQKSGHKSLWNWKSYIKQTLLFSQRNQDRKIMCESDMGGNKSYKMLWTWALEHPSTIWLRHWVQGTSNEISVETEYCTHSKLQQAFFYLEGKKSYLNKYSCCNHRILLLEVTKFQDIQIISSF